MKPEGNRKGVRRSVIPHAARPCSGFSLVELLVVIGIVGLLLSLTVVAFSQVQRSQRLSQAGAMLRDQLQLARQLAIAGNEPVVFNLCETEDEFGTHVLYNTVLLTRPLAEGSPVVRPLRLPAGFAVSGDSEWTSLLSRPGSADLSSGSVPCWQIRFGASGTTDLPISEEWFLTVGKVSDTGEIVPGDNFITLAIDPVTGRTFSYQP